MRKRTARRSREAIDTMAVKGRLMRRMKHFMSVQISQEEVVAATEAVLKEAEEGAVEAAGEAEAGSLPQVLNAGTVERKGILSIIVLTQRKTTHQRRLAALTQLLNRIPMEMEYGLWTSILMMTQCQLLLRFQIRMTTQTTIFHLMAHQSLTGRFLANETGFRSQKK